MWRKVGIPLLLAILLLWTEASAVTNPGYRGFSYPQRGTLDVRSFVGVRVNTHTGNLVLQRTLFFVPGKGLPVHFRLTYNSDHRLISSPFGSGWNLSYHIRYTRDGSGNVVIVWGDGRQDAFTLTGATFTAPPGVYMTLTEPMPGELLLTTKRGIAFHFADSAHQKLTAISDPNGNTVTFAYDAQARLVSVTDAGGRSYTLSYNLEGRLSQLTDTALARTYAFAYDPSGRLVSVTDPLTQAETYAYDADNLLTSITDRRGNPATIAYITPPGDADTRLPQTVTKGGSTVTFAYDTLTRTTTVTDPNGKSWTYAYDVGGRITTLTDPALQATAFTWDGQHNLLSLANRNGSTTAFTYDAVGNILTRTDALLNVSTFTYDPIFSRVLTATNRTSNTWTHVYDANGNRIQSIDPLGNSIVRTFDLAGQMTARTGRNGNTTTFTYDANGNVLTVTDPLAAQTQFAYDGGSRLTQRTNANGNVTSSTYDSLNRVTGVTNALLDSDARTYDANGNLTAYTDFRGNDWLQSFDALNRLTGRSNPLGSTWQYGYDPAGNLITHTDAKLQVTTNTYNDLNRLVGQAFADATTATYTYDGSGNLLTAMDASTNYSYTYDALDRLTQVSANHFAGKAVSNTYDAEGRVLSKTGPEGHLVTYVYDGAGRPTSLTEPGGVSTMTFDAEGNRLTDTRPNGVTTTSTYDATNRPSSIDHTGPGLTVLQSFNYTYDPGGRVTQTTRETGEVITYTYDPLDRVLVEAGGLGTEAYTDTFTYDANGNRVERIFDQPGMGFTNTTTWTHDAANRALTETSTVGTLTFTYDANGSRTMLDFAGIATNTYGYDSRNRLTSLFDGFNTTNFRYDVMDRLIQITLTPVVDVRIIYGPDTQIGQSTDGDNVFEEENTHGSPVTTGLATPTIGDLPFRIIPDSDDVDFLSDRDVFGGGQRDLAYAVIPPPRAPTAGLLWEGSASSGIRGTTSAGATTQILQGGNVSLYPFDIQSLLLEEAKSSFRERVMAEYIARSEYTLFTDAAGTKVGAATEHSTGQIRQGLTETNIPPTSRELAARRPGERDDQFLGGFFWNFGQWGVFDPSRGQSFNPNVRAGNSTGVQIGTRAARRSRNPATGDPCGGSFTGRTSSNNNYWVFFAATTNVEFTLNVTDTETGTVKDSFNPLGSSAPPITDTSAFATCP